MIEEADEPYPEEPDPTEGGAYEIIGHKSGFVNGEWTTAILRWNPDTDAMDWWTPDGTTVGIPYPDDGNPRDPNNPANSPFDKD